MKRLFLPVLLALTSLFSQANVVLTLAGSSTIQSGVPFSLDLTFSNVPTTLGITHVKIFYTISVTPSCVSPSDFKTIGGTYWGNGVGSNPPLASIPPGYGSTFPLTTNMLPMYTGMSANAIINVVTENGKLSNGSTITINAVAKYYTSATSVTPVLTENANSVTVGIIAVNQITGAITTSLPTISMGSSKVFTLDINSPWTVGGLNLYSTGQNLTFNYPACATVFNVYNSMWTAIPFTVVSPGVVKFNSGNINVGNWKTFYVVLNFPCPGSFPCLAGSNVSTSFNVTGGDVCGNFMSIASPIHNNPLVGTCSSGPPIILPPIIIPTSGSGGSGGGMSPGACSITNMVDIQNMSTTTYTNSSFQYTMPNTTNIAIISFVPSIPSSTNIQISYSGVGCPSTPFSATMASPISSYNPPSSVNVVAPTCTTKTISMNFPAPLIAPFSMQKVYFNFSVSSAAPTTGSASFPFIFNSSVLSSPLVIPTTIPYTTLVPNVNLWSEIHSGVNCVNSEYYNPGQTVLLRLKVQSNNSAIINNLVLNDVLNPNLSFDPSYGMKLYVGNLFACNGLPFVSAAMNPVGINYTTGLVNVAGVSMTTNFNTTTNQLTLTCPSLVGAFSCAIPKFLIVEFQARVKPGTLVGSYPNSFTLNGTSLPVASSNTAYVIVNSFYELTLRMKAKRDNGIFSNNLTTCVCQSSLNPNANKITYRGELINTGNVSIKNISIFNMKPKANDLTFPGCASMSRGTSLLVNGLTCYNNPFNMTNNAYSLVPLTFPNSFQSGFTYSGGSIPLGAITTKYYSSGSPIFNAPQLELCSPCASCGPISTVTTPVHFGSAMYTLPSSSSSPGVVLEAGQTISFFTNPVCLQKLPTGTQLVNDFFVQGFRQDLNINTPILQSNPCIVTINTSSCPNTSCDSSIIRKVVIANEYGRYYFRIWNQSGAPVHKVKIDIFPGGCFSSSYSYTQILSTPLAPWAFVDIQNSTAGFPSLPFGACTVTYNITMYSLTSSGVPATYDSCSRSSNWVQYPLRIKSDNEDDHNYAAEIQLYPVPAGNFVKLNMESYLHAMQISEPDLDFLIYDVSGHIVMKYHCSKALEEIDIHLLSPGMYFYTLIDHGEVIHRSILTKE